MQIYKEGNSIYGPSYRLIFSVIEGELKGCRFSGIVRPGSIRHGRFYRWVTNILGDEPEDEFSTDDMVGKECMIYLFSSRRIFTL